MLLVITSCIAPCEICTNLVLVDSQERLRQYCNALNKFVELSAFTEILLCDNSNYDFDFNETYELAAKLNKKFEYLTFEGDVSRIETGGKGTGEIEILQYAFSHSCLMRENDYFYKITGRLYIDNINYILTHTRKTNYFNLNFPCWDKEIDTRFYGIIKKDFERLFLDQNLQVSDKDGEHLESVFYKILNNEHISYRCMPTYPFFVGQSGSCGINYEKLYKRSRYVYVLLAKIGLLNWEPIHRLIRNIKINIKKWRGNG